MVKLHNFLILRNEVLSILKLKLVFIILGIVSHNRKTIPIKLLLDRKKPFCLQVDNTFLGKILNILFNVNGAFGFVS